MYFKAIAKKKNGPLSARKIITNVIVGKAIERECNVEKKQMREWYYRNDRRGNINHETLT